MDFKKELDYMVNKKPKTVVYWLAELVDPETPVALSNEHKDFKWVELEEACKLADYSDMKNLLTDCDLYIKGKLKL